MGIERVTKKLVPALDAIDAVIMMVNATDPQFATLSLFYGAISHLPYFTVLNKTDKVTGIQVRDISDKLGGEVIPASILLNRGLPEVKYRLDHWVERHKVKNIGVFGIFNSGKSSLIKALTGDDIPIGDIPGTTLELTPHQYKGLVLLDTTGQIIDISKPLMVSIDLTGCDTVLEKLTRCLEEDITAIQASVESCLPGLIEAVELIRCCVEQGGKLLTCGAGASSLVAMEIAGQAQETGIPVLCFTNNFGSAQPVSFAKGAFEGEMALARYFANAVSDGDVALGVSASGGTGFVYSFLELARERGAKTIAITENRDTPTGYAANVVIKSEGKPEGPSSSKVMIAHLAIGHAMVLTLADIRGITAERAVKYMLPEECPNKMMGIK